MPLYQLKKKDYAEFDEWWQDNHCEGDGDEETNEKSWARAAFEWGIQYALSGWAVPEPEVSPETPKSNDLAAYKSALQVEKGRVKNLEGVVQTYRQADEFKDARIKRLEESVNRWRKAVVALADLIREKK